MKAWVWNGSRHALSQAHLDRAAEISAELIAKAEAARGRLAEISDDHEPEARSAAN